MFFLRLCPPSISCRKPKQLFGSEDVGESRLNVERGDRFQAARSSSSTPMTNSFNPLMYGHVIQCRNKAAKQSLGNFAHIKLIENQDNADTTDVASKRKTADRRSSEFAALCVPQTRFSFKVNLKIHFKTRTRKIYVSLYKDTENLLHNV